jgi:hypothetical protein
MICYLNHTFIKPVPANRTSDSYGLRRNHICEGKRHNGEDFEQRKHVDLYHGLVGEILTVI